MPIVNDAPHRRPGFPGVARSGAAAKSNSKRAIADIVAAVYVDNSTRFFVLREHATLGDLAAELADGAGTMAGCRAIYALRLGFQD